MIFNSEINRSCSCNDNRPTYKATRDISTTFQPSTFTRPTANFIICLESCKVPRRLGGFSWHFSFYIHDAQEKWKRSYSWRDTPYYKSKTFWINGPVLQRLLTQPEALFFQPPHARCRLRHQRLPVPEARVRRSTTAGTRLPVMFQPWSQKVHIMFVIYQFR